VSFLYLLLLVLALGCMVLIDRRYGLFFWRNARRAALVLVAGVLFFLVWDVFGITLHIFARGDSPYMTGVELLPDLPLEEVFFLAFLCYVTMVLIAGAERLLTARRRRS
jgi:lycopene cyclase domain-containing protein